MSVSATQETGWMLDRIRHDQVVPHLDNGRDFISDDRLQGTLDSTHPPDRAQVRDMIQKSLAVQTLSAREVAALLNVEDEDMWPEMFEAAGEVKRKVYDNRIVTFAPLYLSNLCVNNCDYCGFRSSNTSIKRRRLDIEEVREETEVLAGDIGHKRLIVVYGEHPSTGIDYMVSTVEAIYGVKVKARNGSGQIRRVNVNAAPLSVEELRRLHDVGIGTYQVFQETYHHDTYEALHPQGTIKRDYAWRLYSMHRAFEAGIDDVGIGVLFGLYDWRFEVMGLTTHARELEDRFGVGPHTISFPRMVSAANTPYVQSAKNRVADGDFKKLIAVLRLSVPHTGMILTARESARVRREVLPLGCTQTDASPRIGIGAYSANAERQAGRRQQFFLGDTRSLDEVVRELAGMGYITSFCTAGYRCGRTGKCIMELLRTGAEGKLCKLNAVLTLTEWLEDFASPATREQCGKIIRSELREIREALPSVYPKLEQYRSRILAGERDLYF